MTAKIEVGFSRAKGFAPMGWLIMLCERTSFSHAHIRIYSPAVDRYLIFQATGSGVNFCGDEVFAQKHSEVLKYEFTVQEEDAQRLMQFAVDACGKPYGYLQILGLGLKRILRALGIRVRNPFSNATKAYVCTELVAEALHWAGLSALNRPDEIGLQELSKIVQRIERLKALEKRPRK